MIRQTSLAEAVEAYILARGIAANSSYQVRHTVALYSAWCGRPAVIGDLSDENVSHWLESLEAKYSGRTIAGHRGNLLGIWRECAKRGAVDYPAYVRRVRKPEPLPIAWELEEVRALLEAAEGLAGKCPSGAAKSLYFPTLIRAAYDTGLRRSDLWAIRREQVRPDGFVILLQHKTGRPVYPQFMPATLEGFRQLPGVKPLASPWKSPKCFYNVWRAMVATAGIRPGALQQLRRTGATHIAKDKPEAVQGYLGHLTPTMQRHYVDKSIAKPPIVRPPSL